MLGASAGEPVHYRTDPVTRSGYEKVSEDLDEQRFRVFSVLISSNFVGKFGENGFT